MSAVLLTYDVSSTPLLDMLEAVTSVIAFFAATSDCTVREEMCSRKQLCAILWKDLGGEHCTTHRSFIGF